MERANQGDFSMLVKQDMINLNLNLSLDEIMVYLKPNLKQLVKKLCEDACFLNLLDQKAKISKGKEIEFKSFKMQPYLSSGTNLSSDDICSILKC